MEFIAPDTAALKQFLESYPADTPVVMLNLLKFKSQADYPSELEQQPCTGQEAYMRYSEAVVPMIKACGGAILWQGQQAAMLIGPQDKQWHLAVLVKYPGTGDFISMVTAADYQKIVIHRDAALEDSRLIAHREL